MVNPNALIEMKEVQQMVKRDPKMRDVFPEPKKGEIATYRERAQYGIRSHARLNVPLCYSIEELYDWAEQLHTVATRIQAITVKKDVKEIWRLMEIKGVVDQLNKESEQDIAKMGRALAEEQRRIQERR
jgi:hypothetical protein